MGIYKKRENYYMIDYYLDKKRIWEHGGRTRTEARYKLEKRRTDVREGKLSLTAIKDRITFKNFAIDYLKKIKESKRSYSREKIIVKCLIKYFGNKTLNKIIPNEIENYMYDRLKYVKKSTVNRETIVLRHMLNEAVKLGKMMRSPMINIKQFKIEERAIRVISKDEEEKLLNASCNHLKSIIIAALNTGMRLGEILNLKWENVDLEKEIITLTKTKSGKIRTIPINNKLKEVLKCAINVNSEYVFCDDCGKPIESIKTAFNNALRRSGINKCRFHDTRATFTTRLIENNVNLVTVQNLLGHADIKTTMKYANPNSEYNRQAVETLN
ncbi:MAG: site-specific integrase [Candidatus Omnitrophica bacterium]|nr:site-specific integrase [Candidatus Omnitrophota bacterium]